MLGNGVSGNQSLVNNGGIVGAGNSQVTVSNNTIQGNGSGVSNGAILAAGNSTVNMTGNHVVGTTRSLAMAPRDWATPTPQFKTTTSLEMDQALATVSLP